MLPIDHLHYASIHAYYFREYISGKFQKFIFHKPRFWESRSGFTAAVSTEEIKLTARNKTHLLATT